MNLAAVANGEKAEALANVEGDRNHETNDARFKLLAICLPLALVALVPAFAQNLVQQG
jgi:hypothetical protein